MGVISINNRKMGAIPSISFPPVITCANCAECAKKCYALKMTRIYKGVGERWKKNLDEWKKNPSAVKYEIIAAAVRSKYFRFFVGGDIPDSDFFKVMIECAETVKDCNFLAFTKKYHIVNDFLNGGGVLEFKQRRMYPLY